MTFQDSIDNLNGAIADMTARVKAYFSQIDEQERYGWMAEGTGAVLAITGLVLLML
jgi:hypothetical protein